MIRKKKTIKLLMLMSVLLLTSVFTIAQVKIDATKLQLANRYFNDDEFEKAAVLYKEIYQVSRNQHYFDYYINCLVELNDYDTAEKALKQQFRRTNDPSLLVQLGYLYKQQGRIKESVEKYAEALKLLPNNKNDVVQLAKAFITRREYEWAEKVYLKGRQKIGGEAFNYELARVYLYQRNFEMMLEEYLDMLRVNEENSSRVQSGIRSAMRNDMDNSLPDLFRNIILKRIQSEPGVLAYNRLLIWFFMQQKQYLQAFKQAVALDKRTGTEGQTILLVARNAGISHDWDAALQGYNHLIEKGISGSNLLEIQLGKMSLLYQQFLAGSEGALVANELEREFYSAFQKFGYKPETTKLLIQYAHFLSFYQDKADDGILLLKEGMKIPRLQPHIRAEMKNEMADIYVYKNDPWEAVLLYSQVIEENRNHSLADEVKLKKARLAYYMGNMEWAQAQLDVIKASTSKLVANDALELSIFISNNTSLDTTEVPMQLFARADLLAFQNKTEKAWIVLDSIEHQYAYHSLLDDVYFRKAKVKINQNDFEAAAEYLQTIIDDFSYDLLADDALFLLAKIKEEQLNQKEEAMELYKSMLTQHPGSIYVTEARKRYRKLRGDDV